MSQASAPSAPRPLRDLKGWLCWRSEQTEGEAKPRKIPYWADGTRRSGQQGSSIDRARLVTFHEARQAAERLGMSGVGFAPMPEWGVVAIDFDNCVEGGALHPDVEAALAGTYAEFSPSGKGVRGFVTGDLGNHKSHMNGHEYGFETFASKGFVTVTGNMLDTCDLLGYHDTIAPANTRLTDLCQTRFGRVGTAAFDPDDFMAGYEPRLGLDVARMQELLTKLDPDMGREQWRNVGFALHHECEGDDTGFDLWDDWSSGGAKYPGTEELRYQWESFAPTPGRRQVTMASVMKMAKDADREAPASVESAQAHAEAMRPADAPVGRLSAPADYAGKYHFVSAAEVALRPPMEWFIKGVLPRADMGMIYGASGSGKSFVAFDMACALARGVPWRGRRTRKCRVALIVAEGAGGVAARVKAYCAQHNLTPEELNISILTAAPNIMLAEEINELVAGIVAAGGFDIILIDTMAQVTPGANENAGEDMGLALANMRTLKDATGAMPALIHHAGKDASKGARGWSGMRAAMDFEIEVSREEDGPQREIRLTKQKDGEDGLRFGFTLQTVTVGMDADGDEITSCVVVETDLPAPKSEGDPGKRIKKRGAIERHVLEMATIREPDVAAVKLEDFVAKCAETLPMPDNGRDVRRQNVRRAIQSLSREKDGALGVEGGLVIFYE